ncbi:unnamed protein product [Durusdinium trenchii]|uniref:Uncharacterized protein n=1 Tax=Durusdinium trenchii TaxID=1381693 RepID=A0ABP0KSP1_9DINO
MPVTNRLLALAGVIAILPVVPLLGTYRDACSCECCKGLGCSPKLALFIVAWTTYGFSTLWVVSVVAEDAGELGGKVLFIITQGVSISSMAASRKMAELAEAKATESSYRMAEFGCTGAEMVGATVGSPVMVGPAVQELQSTVERLEQQVQDLSKRQAMMERELAFQKKVEAATGGVDVMMAAGWLPDTSPEGEDCWLLGDAATSMQASVSKRLSEELKKLPAPPTPAPAPVPAPVPSPSPGGYGGMPSPGGFPGLGGLPGGLPPGMANNPMMQQMMNNPQMMQQAQQMMQDPNMMSQVQQMMQNPQAMAQLQQMMGGGGFGR